MRNIKTLKYFTRIQLRNPLLNHLFMICTDKKTYMIKTWLNVLLYFDYFSYFISDIRKHTVKGGVSYLNMT